MIKGLQEWHEMSIDCVILALYYLQGHHLTEFYVDIMAWDLQCSVEIQTFNHSSTSITREILSTRRNCFKD